MSSLENRAKRIAIDRLGTLVDKMQVTARVLRKHEHGDPEATEKAADLIWQFRKKLQGRSMKRPSLREFLREQCDAPNWLLLVLSVSVIVYSLTDLIRILP